MVSLKRVNNSFSNIVCPSGLKWRHSKALSCFLEIGSSAVMDSNPISLKARLITCLSILIKPLGLSKSGLAGASGISRNTLYRILIGGVVLYSLHGSKAVQGSSYKSLLDLMFSFHLSTQNMI